MCIVRCRLVAGPRVGLAEVVLKYLFAEFEIDLSQQELCRLGEAVHIEPGIRSNRSPRAQPRPDCQQG